MITRQRWVKAILWALEQARPGDAVLLAGDKHLGGDTAVDEHALDDCEIARRWLYQSAKMEAAAGIN